MAKAAFLGLGVMGYPMAGHLANAGLTVQVWNRTHAKAESWASQYKGKACDSIAAAVADADFVFTCVGADVDLEKVYEGPEGIIANAKPDTVANYETNNNPDLFANVDPDSQSVSRTMNETTDRIE